MKSLITKKIGSAWKQFLQDIKDNWVAFFTIILYFFFTGSFFHTICPMSIFTGFPCPGCGLTRAGIALMKGNFSGAWELHPFIYIFLILVVLFVLQRYFFKKMEKFFQLFAMISLMGLIAFYIYRMIRFFPGQPPMDYDYNSLLYKVYRLLSG